MLQGMDVCSILQNAPSCLFQTAALQFSIKVYTALATGNARAYVRLHGEAGWRQQQLMDVCMDKVRPTYVLCVQPNCLRMGPCIDW